MYRHSNKKGHLLHIHFLLKTKCPKTNVSLTFVNSVQIYYDTLEEGGWFYVISHNWLFFWEQNTHKPTRLMFGKGRRAIGSRFTWESSSGDLFTCILKSVLWIRHCEMSFCFWTVNKWDQSERVYCNPCWPCFFGSISWVMQCMKHCLCIGDF